MKLDSFTRSYIETALWASTDELGDPLDMYGLDEIDPACLAEMIQDCLDFQLQDNYAELATDGTDERAGHDFWLTRNGHGAGFWDGGWKHGDELTAMSKPYGSFDLYVGDDGLIYSLWLCA